MIQKTSGLVMIAVVALSLSASATVQKKKVAKAPAAKAAAPAAAQQAAATGHKKLSKDISFTGAAVDGKYLSAGDSIAEVEGDKEMGALIGIRKNFHDRLGDETARLQAAQKAGGQ